MKTTGQMKQLFIMALLFCSLVSRGASFTATSLEGVTMTFKTIDSNNVYLYSVEKSAVKVTIPRTINGYTVSEIWSCAFDGCQNLETVSIPTGIESIGSFAFRNCKKLASISIPSTVREISNNAFQNCISLKTISVPSSVELILNAAFEGCTGLIDVQLSEKLTKINNRLFYGCFRLTHVGMSSGITQIGDNAFYGCNQLEGIFIPETIESIGYRAFHECSSLYSIDLSSVKTIEKEAFAMCINLYSVRFGEGLDRIGKSSFLNCTNLKCVTFPESLQTIEDEAFERAGIENVELPSNATVGKYAFSSCEDLKTVIVGTSKISNDAFRDCDNIESLSFLDGVTEIGSAFHGLKKLKSISIPSSVERLNKSFYSCTNLESVTLSEGLKEIGDFSFSWCDSLQSISIPNSVLTIGSSAFVRTALKEIVIPQSVISIKGNCFSCCKNLKSIKVVEGNSIYDSRSNCNAIIHTASNELIAGCYNAIIPNNIEVIGEGAFEYCTDISSITIPESVTRICNNAFYGCTSLTSITSLENVDSIGEHAFEQCRGLTSFVVPSKVKTIAKSLFYECKNLSSISIPEGVILINNDAFYYCENLVNLNIPSSVTSIGEYAFWNCRSLPSIQIPEGVQLIGNSAFENCKSLKAIQIPEGVKSIGSDTFDGCDSIQAIILPNSLEEISASAFGYGKNLQYIRVGQTPPTVNSSYIYDLNTETITLLVPSVSESAYKSAPAWSKFKNIFACDFLGTSQEGVQLAISITNEDEKTAMVTGTLDKSISGDLTIPAEINGYQIIAIGEKAFSGCSKLEGIFIPATIKSMGNKFLDGCTALNAITVDEGNTVFDSRDNCNAILETATNKLIASCRTTVIPNGTQIIGARAFQRNKGITKVIIPEGVKTIEDLAFVECENLKELSLPNTLENIADDAFSENPNIQIIKSSIAQPFGIDKWTFGIEDDNYYDYFNNSIYEKALLFVPAGSQNAYQAAEGWELFENIREYDFFATTTDGAELAFVTTNEQEKTAKVTSIVDKSTAGRVTIPLNVNGYSITGIGKEAFFECPSITAISIPSSVTNVEDYALAACKDLANIVVAGDNSVYDSRNNCNAVIETATGKLIAGCKETIIPSGVTSIGNNAFYYCEKIHSIDIPEGVNSIGQKAFLGCDSLNAISLPNSLECIEYGAFMYCNKLTSLILPQNLTSIAGGAFEECTGLTSIKVGMIPPSITSETFNRVNKSSVKLYVPFGCISAYNSADYWNQFTNIEELPFNKDDYEYVLYTEDVEAAKGGRINLAVKLKNATETVYGFDFKLYLPDGITLLSNSMMMNQNRFSEIDKPIATLHEDNGTYYRITFYSLEPFSGTDGEVVRMTLMAANDVVEGDYSIILKDVVMPGKPRRTGSNAKSTLTVIPYDLGDVDKSNTLDAQDCLEILYYSITNEPFDKFYMSTADVNGNGEADVVDILGINNMIHYGYYYKEDVQSGVKNIMRKSVSDFSAMNNVIYIDPVQAQSGQDVVLSVKMNNQEPIYGFKFNLELPEGVNYVRASLSEERIQLSNIAQRVIRKEGITCYMSYDDTNKQYYTIDGNEGEIATITIHLSEDLAVGDYPITLNNIVMSNTYSSSGIQGSNKIESLLSVVEPSDERIILDENSEVEPVSSDGAVDVRVMRTIKANEWNTICLPFAMTVEQVKEAFGEEVQLADFIGVETTLDEAANITALSVNFDEATAIEANHPYIIKVSDEIAEFTVDEVVIAPDDASVNRDENRVKVGSKYYTFYNSFIGTYVAQTELPAKTLFLNNNKFYYSAGSTKMKAFRGYFDFYDVLTDVENAYSEVKMFINGLETKVDGIGIKDATGTIYDLNGRKVAKPQQRGIYIVNGSKIVK